MEKLYKNGLLQTLGGACGLSIVMGVGRFAYTAMLPSMMQKGGVDAAVAGNMAALNLVGYLLGVLAMRREKPGKRRYGLYAAFLVLSVATTAGMGLTHAVQAWHAIRFLSGFASGACFVLCSAIVLDTLMALQRPALAGFLYSGVGVGIALGGMLAQPLENGIGLDGAWIGLGVLCLPLCLASLVCLRPGVNPTLGPAARGAQTDRERGRGQCRDYFLLLASYFLEGFGYIIGTTFLVSLVRETTHSVSLANASWMITGCAAACSAPVWRHAARGGYLSMLALAYVLQGVGTLLPALSAAPASIALGGLLLGGTFMGITVLSLQYGVSLSGKPSAHTVAVMTALYGVGQIIGPYLAGISAQGRGFGPAFILSSAALFSAALLLGVNRVCGRRGG